MKLIMENWRTFVNEQEQGCKTVGELIQTLDKMQGEEDEAEVRKTTGQWFWRLATTLGELGLDALKAVPGVGTVAAVGDAGYKFGKEMHSIFKDLKTQINSKDKAIKYDQVSDFPILGHLKIDPELVKVLEDDILQQLDEMYEEQVLKKIKPETCIDDILSINEFIRKTITKETDRKVTIKDTSGTPQV